MPVEGCKASLWLTSVTELFGRKRTSRFPGVITPELFFFMPVVFDPDCARTFFELDYDDLNASLSGLLIYINSILAFFNTAKLSVHFGKESLR